MKVEDSFHPKTQRRIWRTQRAIWTVMAVFLILVAVGFFGTGPLSDATVRVESDAYDLDLQYPQWNRDERVSAMILTLDANRDLGENLTVAFSTDTVPNMNVRSPYPAATSTALGPRGATYTWNVEGWSEPMAIRFTFLPLEIGSWEGHLTVKAGGEPEEVIAIPMFVFP